MWDKNLLITLQLLSDTFCAFKLTLLPLPKGCSFLHVLAFASLD